MDKSIFTDKNSQPNEEELQKALKDLYPLWKEISDYVFSKYPAVATEWKYPGEKHGWSYRIKDKKRVIIYLLPRDSYFKVALVFSQKATDEVLASGVAEAIKTDLAAARAYAEGRGIRINVKDSSIIKDIKLLTDIKLAN